ncbi:hypothetical protein FB567DRAFT_184936 [Paraphoma chrysanthemicola]|uniref:F-box domain-containing protein n=1 Tax=Paraphoma chrysanthemicola TaxID=798071 RepID=A0A8K0QYP5_9PLEO|nr:hypothetical protein FB567DRAFT_184936 [Paraphoma chrysanthemicola]
MATQPPASLGDLPSELLLQIFAHVDPYAEERVLGHIPDDPPPSHPDPYLVKDFLECNSSLFNLALTTRTFRDIAQERLLYAPVIGGFAFRLPGEKSVSRIAFLLRTLLLRPQLRRHVRHLRLCFPPDEDPHDVRLRKEEVNLETEPLSFADIVRQCRKVVASLDIPEHLKKMMTAQMIMDFRHILLGVMMALLPHLEVLSFSDFTSQTSPPSSWSSRDVGVACLNLAGIRQTTSKGADIAGLQCFPAAATLKRVKVSSVLIVRLDGLYLCPQLDTLDICIKLAGLDGTLVADLKELFSDRSAIANFQNIRHLRIDCQVKSMGIWDFSARVCMSHLLLPFRGLKSLDYYAEPSSEKNPFRSLRAFPHYQANIQSYPAAITETVTETSYWDERLYEARTQYTDYQYLVDTLVNVRSGLESLRLPGGFWTLPGAMRKPLPRFVLFPRLHTLVIPQAAILSIILNNMRFPEVVKGDFELLPTEVLPPKLRYLKIHDVDASLLQSEWLKDLFERQAEYNQWPELQELEILCGPMIDDASLADLLERRSSTDLWERIDKAAFKVTLGRDDDVPSIHGIV